MDEKRYFWTIRYYDPGNGTPGRIEIDNARLVNVQPDGKIVIDGKIIVNIPINYDEEIEVKHYPRK